PASNTADVQANPERHRHPEQRSAHGRRDRRRTGVASSGNAITVPIVGGPTGFVPRNRFAPASAAASPVHRPAPSERARRCDGLIGIAPVSALTLTMIAATRTTVPMKSSMTPLLYVVTPI